MNAKKFTTLILKWFDQHGRKNLPWQKNKTPYRVWVSEIMLQQTQVITVIPYFERFIEHFPDVQTLAAAHEDTVLHLWTGLGYYSRARNLHKTANIIHHSHQNKFPDSIAELEELPGIGRSTAGAIMALAFQKKATILDGNVKRVLTRLQGITEWPGEKKVMDQLWSIAENYTPSQRIADYTQAMMDIGATLCVRGTPRCQECPLQPYCLANQQGIAKTLPRSKPASILPIRQVTLLVLQKNSHHILLEKRPATGIWGGLWSLPEAPQPQSLTQLKKLCQQRFRYEIKAIEYGTPFRHTFSHFHLEITPAFIAIKANRKLMEAEQQIWYNLQQPAAVGLPAPVKKLLQRMTK
jgi:A/G-specific adenine glycosylase